MTRRGYSNCQSREVKGNMATIEEKLARLDTIRQRVESFVTQRGDMGSDAAITLGRELGDAANDLAVELGYKLITPIKNKRDFMRPDPASGPMPDCL
jgi:hypothetical protein